MSPILPVRRISHEKLEQATAVLREQGLDCWLLLGRETAELCDPSLALLLDTSVTWTSAFLVTAAGRRIAIVGRYDVANLRAEGGFDEVVGYDEDLKGPLLAVLEALDPGAIGLNYSVANHTSDGLTHGLYLHLQAMLEGTPFAGRLRSADAVASAVRARKSRQELERIRTAVGTAQAVFDAVTGYLRPGLTERQVYDFVRAEVDRRGVTPSWDARYCPTLNAGPRSPEGHTQATDTAVEAGHWFHMDFGVRQAGYCSDHQRAWYLRRPGEAGPARDLRRAFDTVVAAIQRGFEMLRPGVEGWRVDAAAREVLRAAGYPEFKHALGHQVGRTVHDGAALLGPRWPRYGETVHMPVEEGAVFTLELGVRTEAGLVSLEEMVVVESGGAGWLWPPQTAPILV